ncbi:MAG: hypothetical protein F6K47_17620 [Symploca sp. SIO2E6]|nr:hypothetical protein [Symploca sp. SIO2E6]
MGIGNWELGIGDREESTFMHGGEKFFHGDCLLPPALQPPASCLLPSALQPPALQPPASCLAASCLAASCLQSTN